MKEVNFDLNDRFCDENDLRSAWQNKNIPKPFITFFSKLFNVSESDIFDYQKNAFSCNETLSISKSLKLLQIENLFQIIYFTQTKGKKTPLHVLTGLFVYHTTKSKSTIKQLNRLGESISYEEVLRIKTRLAAYANINCRTIVPLPSHFDPSSYVTAAFDNFDHNETSISGLESTHDTVAVIFQDYNANYHSNKPKVSVVSLNYDVRSFNTKLKCQEVMNFMKLSSTITLPSDFTCHINHRSFSTQQLQNDLQKDDFVWYLSRMNISKDDNDIKTINSSQNVPTWSSFISTISTDRRSKQIVGFLPILSAPVTEYATVYTSLCNFKDILSQLKQKQLAVTCDEGVYKIARHITLVNKTEFENIIVLLGNFHMIKVLLSCIGKYLKHSGAESIFIETNLFGVSVTEQVLNGTHYARSVKGFNYLSESLRRMQLKEFFTAERREKYEYLLVTIILLKENFETNELDDCFSIMNDFRENCSELLNDFHNFIISRCQESELFHYWNNVLIMVNLMNDLIRADRSGNWSLHVETVQKVLPIFNVMDRVNYTRWGSIYVEDILTLDKNSPEIYLQFLNSRFTVQQSDILFTSVSPDQALEQTINRTSKSKAGVIGITKNKESVAAWNLTYHELLDISDLFKKLTLSNDTNEELDIHHEFSKRSAENSEVSITSILNFFENQSINPFMPGSQKLRNLVTGELVHSDNAKEILNIFSTGAQLYEKFRNERIVEKIKPLSATIPRYNLPSFKTVPAAEKSKKEKKNVVKKGEINRIIALANQRNYSIEKLLTYDLTFENKSFDADGLIKKENNKSSLVRELEKKLQNDENVFDKSKHSACLIVDVMLVMRKIGWKGKKTFEDLAISLNQYVQNKIDVQATKRIDFIFDSYFENSPKSSERLRRCQSSCIIFNDINEATALPKEEDKFWGASENKILLQTFLCRYIEKHQDRFSNIQIVFSTTNTEPCKVINYDNSEVYLQVHQRNDIEESDIKIMIHINHAVMNGFINIHVISSDTDVIVLALYFYNFFQEKGLQVC